jgi:NAD(P)-dependent dehydrogenase (short-subunit alcohol dehydrogenase family)
MNPKGQAAVVTGAASGLGAAAARALAAAGAKLALFDQNLKAAEAVAGEIGGLAFECDVSDAQSAEAAFAKARAAHGPARINVNCAGVVFGGRVVGRSGPHPLGAFARVVQVNLIGTFNTLRLAAADMAALDPLADGERGVIVNTSSVAAFDGQTGQAAYAASKGGIAALTLPAARDLARSGVRVVAIAPGLFATPMMFGLPPESQKSLGESVPFPARLGKPEEFAALVLHVVENVMLNGEVIRLDGAVRLPPK